MWKNVPKEGKNLEGGKLEKCKIARK